MCSFSCTSSLLSISSFSSFLFFLLTYNLLHPLSLSLHPLTCIPSNLPCIPYYALPFFLSFLPPSPFITFFAAISRPSLPLPLLSFFIIYYKFSPGSSSLSSFLSPSNLEYPPLFPVVLVLDELVEIKAADICVRDDRPFTIHIHIHIRKHNNQH